MIWFLCTPYCLSLSYTIIMAQKGVSNRCSHQKRAKWSTSTQSLFPHLAVFSWSNLMLWYAGGGSNGISWTPWFPWSEAMPGCLEGQQVSLITSPSVFLSLGVCSTSLTSSSALKFKRGEESVEIRPLCRLLRYLFMMVRLKYKANNAEKLRSAKGTMRDIIVIKVNLGLHDDLTRKLLRPAPGSPGILIKTRSLDKKFKRTVQDDFNIPPLHTWTLLTTDSMSYEERSKKSHILTKF